MRKLVIALILVGIMAVGVMAVGSAAPTGTIDAQGVGGSPADHASSLVYSCRTTFSGPSSSVSLTFQGLTENYVYGNLNAFSTTVKLPSPVDLDQCDTAANAEQVALADDGWTTGPITASSFSTSEATSFRAYIVGDHATVLTAIHNANARLATTPVP